MDWKRNGVGMGRHAPNIEPPSYVFHGSYSGLKAGYNVQDQDLLSFRHSIGPGGAATLTVYGDHTFTNNPPCKPGSPC